MPVFTESFFKRKAMCLGLHVYAVVLIQIIKEHEFLAHWKLIFY